VRHARATRRARHAVPASCPRVRQASPHAEAARQAELDFSNAIEQAELLLADDREKFRRYAAAERVQLQAEATKLQQRQQEMDRRQTELEGKLRKREQAVQQREQATERPQERERRRPGRGRGSRAEASDVPQEAFCPITQAIMADPVSTLDGHTYDRAAIERWLAQSSLSPVTGLALASRRLIPNYSLRSIISDLGLS